MAEREKPMAEADVTAWLAANLPNWKLEDGWIRRTYKTASWKSRLRESLCLSLSA